MPNGHDQTLYLIVNKFGTLGTSFAETDVEQATLDATIIALMSGEYSDPVAVVAINITTGWSSDASENVAREIYRAELTGRELVPTIESFVEGCLWSDRQLTLRFA